MLVRYVAANILLNLLTFSLQKNIIDMLKHIVIFRLKDDIEPAKKTEVMNAFKSGILALPAVIPTIRQIAVGFNVNADEASDICLESTFDSLEDVKAYAVNPHHVAVAAALKPYVAARSCADFEVE